MHEHLDEFGLINMNSAKKREQRESIGFALPSWSGMGEANGRMYGPHYATFLSPDPVLQSPDKWLNYNRYSYCFGNPLKYSDPSGLRGVRMTKGNNPNSQENTVGEYDDGYEHDTRCVYNPQTDTYDGGTFNAVEIIGQRQQTSMFNALFDQVCKAISKFQNGMENSYDTGGYSSNNISVSGFSGALLAIGKELGRQSENILNDRGAYMPRGEIAKRKIPVTLRTPIGNVNTTSKVLGKVAKAGKGCAIVGVAKTFYDIQNDYNKGNKVSAGTRAVVFGVATATAYIPVVGWGVSLSIGVADAMWGDQFYNYVEQKFGGQ